MTPPGMPPRRMATLALTGLHLATATGPLVRDVSLTLRRGRVLGVVGRSGSGKTLTTLAMLDLLPPGVRRTGGSLVLDGVPTPAAGLRGGTVGYIQQAPRGGFNPLVTIGRHFRETLAATGLRGPAAQARMEELLAEVGFETPGDIPPLYPSELSGGMLQRAMIALAVCRDPAFLLADEPTTDLDMVVQAQVLALLERLVAGRGIGLMLVSHDLSVIARLGGEVAVMEGGTIVEHQAVHAFFTDPRHPRSQALLAAHRALYAP